MPIMPDITYTPSAVQQTRFKAGSPIGIVLHRTVAKYAHIVPGFTKGPKAPHFLVGKQDGEAVQFVDTDYKAAHAGAGANDLYIGIEFESIAAPRHFKGLYAPAIRDNLTPFQIDMGRQIVDWICATHSIPKVGPPSASSWTNLRGHWRGVLGHADAASGGFFHTTHGDTLQFIDFMALGVWPAPNDKPKYRY